MPIKFSEDVVHWSDIKVNPVKIVNRENDNKRPILVTSRGRGVAVVQGLEEYEILEEKVAFMQAVAKGLMEAKEGQVTDLTDAKRVLGLEK
jgi:prevent-host-death family protein